ncbi:Ig domain-containing protein [Streptomyces diastaticus]|uniref:Ig-like domain-containing protein n=1 Tax=Streptomyces diastaticus TaxID=1956 RepID=UPI0038082BC3
MATRQLAASVSYADGSTRDVSATATWVSSDPEVATVSTAGLVTAVAVGSADITATAEGKSGKCAVTVTNPATGLAVSPATASVEVG